MQRWIYLTNLISAKYFILPVNSYLNISHPCNYIVIIEKKNISPIIIHSVPWFITNTDPFHSVITTLTYSHPNPHPSRSLALSYAFISSFFIFPSYSVDTRHSSYYITDFLLLSSHFLYTALTYPTFLSNILFYIGHFILILTCPHS